MADFQINELAPAEIGRLNAALTKCRFSVGDSRGAFVFERSAQLLTRLSKTERDLVLTLFEDFLYCSFFESVPLLQSALEKIPDAVARAADQVILLPLAETRKNGRPKSSSALLYPAEHAILPYMPSFAGKPVSVYEKMDLLNSVGQDRKNALIIFLDDFIGTGDSGAKTIERYRRTVAKPSDRLAVAGIVGQQEGVRRIEREGVGTYVAIERRKGISESSLISDRDGALALMDEVEQRLGVAAKYRRGYGKSEALVTLTRTPNNTFPIFWHPTTASGDPWPAPFRRFG